MTSGDGNLSPEDSLIARHFRPLATHSAARGLMDDAAVLAASGDDLVVTTDAIVEGVHFLPDDPPDTIARKALRVNLSDLAAKGARPSGFVLTLALREVRDEFLAPFARALGEDIAAFDCALLGGDMVATSGPLMISITAFGTVAPGRAVARRGAGVGDAIFVTGTIGDAALGLDLLKRNLNVESVHRNALIDRYRVPQPRTALADAVRDHASAAMDVSDGLAGDLAKLCAASGVSATVDAASVPLSDAARSTLQSGQTDLSRLLTGGDDYEILCTIPQNQREAFQAAADAAKVAVCGIGRIVAGDQPPVLLDSSGTPMVLKRPSYSHF